MCVLGLGRSHDRLTGQTQQRIAVDVPLKMRRETIERLLDGRLIVEPRRLRVQAFEPARALTIIGEKTMDVATHRPAIRAHRSVLPATGESQDRPCQIRSRSPADVHFVTPEGDASRGAKSLHLFQGFVAVQDGFAIEKAKPLEGARVSFGPIGIADAAPEHLVAAANAEH